MESGPDSTDAWWEQEGQKEDDADERVMELYNELIMAVERNHPGETRHQTALRYIREAEKQTGKESTDANPKSGT